MDRERIKELAFNAVCHTAHFESGDIHSAPTHVTKKVEDAITLAVNEALEEAAKIAESQDGPSFHCRLIDHEQDFCECRGKATDIRALKLRE